MATYVNDLRLKEIATGDESGTWGTSTNTNLELIAEAFSFGTEAITTNADTHTTTIADGATDPGRSLFLKYTGTLDSTCTITIGPNTISKLWFIENATSGSQSIIISQGSGANITILNGQTKAIYSDGAGSGAAMVDAFTDLSVPSFFVSGDLDVDGTTNLDVVDIDGALTQDGGAVFNEASADVDFRVESNGNTHMLFVDAGNDRVGVGISSPTTTLDVAGSVRLKTGATGTPVIVSTGGDSQGTLRFGSSGNEYSINSGADYVAMIFNTNGAERMRIDSSGNVGIGTSSPSATLALDKNTTTQHRVLDLENNSITYSMYVDQDNSSTNSWSLFDTTNSQTALRYLPSSSGYWQFYTNGTERMRIDSSGNLLLQQTSAAVYDSNTTGDVSNFWKMSVSGSSTNTRSLVGSNSTGGIFGGARLNSGNTRPIITSFMEFSCPDTTAGAETGEIYFYTKPSGGVASSTKRMVIDSSGNVGIGTSSPSSYSANANNLVVYEAGNGGITIANGTSNEGALYFADGTSGSDVARGVVYYSHATNHMGFSTDSVERMRLDQNGNLQIGTTDNGPGSPDGIVIHSAGANIQNITTNNTTASAHYIGRFYSGAVEKGSIYFNGTSVAYNTSSDYRLKDVDGPVTNSGAYIDALKPVQGSWKADGSRFIGLIAHEAQEVSETPIATGEKDGEEMQGMDYASPEIIANLVAEIQSLRARVQQLENN